MYIYEKLQLKIEGGRGLEGLKMEDLPELLMSHQDCHSHGKVIDNLEF